MMILGWPLTFLRYGHICVLVVVAILEELFRYAIAVFIRWKNHGPQASGFFYFIFFFFFNRKVLVFWFILHENMCCGYLLEAPHWGTFNEIQQLMFSWRNKKKMIIEIPYSKCPKLWNTNVSDKMQYANSADPDQTAPEGAVWSGS